MKAVIVELKNNLASLLTDDGCVETIKNNKYEIGQVIHMNSNKKINLKKISAIAGSAAAFILLGAGTWAYASPYTYVSIDVNPSIEYSVNRFDRVIKVNAVNDDGEDILNKISIDMSNQTIDAAIASTVQQITDAGYFDGDTEGGIVITTSCKDTDKADAMAEELKQSVEQETAENGDTVDVETYSVGLERVEEAKALGVTPGKLNLVEKLQEAAGDSTKINTQEWLSKPVKDIMKETKGYLKNTGKTDDDAVVEDQDEENSDIAPTGSDIGHTEQDTDKAEAKKDKTHGKSKEIEAEDNEEAAYEDADETDTSELEDSDKDNTEKQAKEAVKHAEEKAKKAAERAKEQAKKEAEQAKEQAKEQAERAKKQVEDNDNQDSEINEDNDEGNSDYEDNHSDNSNEDNDEDSRNINEDNDDQN